MALICGVEEAGRGPVIGPLVMAAVLIDQKDLEKLENIGVKDSKQLTPLQRERMFERIIEAVQQYQIEIISPQKVDAAVESEETNLNWLEADTSITLIEALKPEAAFLDCPSTNIEAYKKYVEDKLTIDCEIIAEHKADEKYVVVGAASILAKVTRDREIQKIKDELKSEIGSGYPADPMTQAFLKHNFEKHPDIFRKSWKSYKRLVKGKKQTKLNGY